ncbi:hypothetical protein SAMN05660420_00285 [Desulfuromusa kysingii]|uniref:Uncharacterized protein n=1 Tax=Desulfuromusa kysingii TaxID=37625 RepID=A0A1H3VU80_9BACT|nr:hypothetical protein [Desulfuromusa kysingii]SDZ78319.1 hypothetical protein SAMN05660420_00285 [Desulfuromusa kysingii]
MQSTTLSVGDPIEGRCTKCRKNTNHIVISLKDDAPEKVECQTCSRQHKYRPPTVAKKPAARKTTKPKDADRKQWESLRPEMESAKAKPYSMTETYKLNNLIDHPSFGLGIVQRVIGSQKVEILFADGRKTMRCQ